VAQESQERAAAGLRKEDHARKLRQLAAKRKALEAQIVALQAEGEVEEAEVTFVIAQETLQTSATQQNADAMSDLRGGVKSGPSRTKGKR
jgi:circadian clock protein KaiC